jgi:DNA sulfur modification protein DndD
MFVSQITLDNFRVYSGNHLIRFSVDSDKNITIVAGNNGFGKTSFLTSLVWCLYGKLMVDVDDRYRQDIAEVGGYKRYCEKLMNRHTLSESGPKVEMLQLQLEGKNLPQREAIYNQIDDLTSFSVSIRFSDLMIPSVSCSQIDVVRTYNVFNKKERLEILIDGRPNELTKNVGPEIFINDFILPKEIAKFFFFDAEKIVSLAEVNTVEEKRYLSQAYAEVLGIKKYTDLKSSLEQLRYRIREKSAVKSDRTTLERLNKQLEQARKMTLHKADQLEELSEHILVKRSASDKYQEQLIREGSAITLSELLRLREHKNALSANLAQLKSRFNELLDLAPFAMLAGKMSQVKEQIETESNNSASSISLLQQKFSIISGALRGQKDKLGISEEKHPKLLELIRSVMLPEQGIPVKMMLNFTPEQQNGFFAVYDNLKNAYSKTFKTLINDQKRLQTVLNNVNRRLQDAESKGRDPVIAGIRQSKDKLEDEIRMLDKESVSLLSQRQQLDTEMNTYSRQISELSKKVQLEDVDQEKDATAERLIRKLDTFIQKLKIKKKGSLEKNIYFELNKLMHKSDFVSRVNVVILGELIDIELYDNNDVFIDKELLSKGEQQLYATALLKALVDESNIRFPVFIDSPLQKFDKMHSQNIITEFYPNLSAQVVLFPLLQKELSEEEYGWMLNKVGKSYLIKQSSMYNSGFEEVEPELLFNWFKQTQQYV